MDTDKVLAHIEKLMASLEDELRRRLISAEVDIQMLKQVAGFLAHKSGMTEDEFGDLLARVAEDVSHPECKVMHVSQVEEETQKIVEEALKKAGGLH